MAKDPYLMAMSMFNGGQPVYDELAAQEEKKMLAENSAYAQNMREQSQIQKKQSMEAGGADLGAMTNAQKIAYLLNRANTTGKPLTMQEASYIETQHPGAGTTVKNGLVTRNGVSTTFPEAQKQAQMQQIQTKTDSLISRDPQPAGSPTAAGFGEAGRLVNAAVTPGPAGIPVVEGAKEAVRQTGVTGLVESFLTGKPRSETLQGTIPGNLGAAAGEVVGGFDAMRAGYGKGPLPGGGAAPSPSAPVQVGGAPSAEQVAPAQQGLQIGQPGYAAANMQPGQYTAFGTNAQGQQTTPTATNIQQQGAPPQSFRGALGSDQPTKIRGLMTPQEAMAKAEAGLTKRERLALFEGELATRDTGKQRRAAAIRQKIEAAGTSAENELNRSAALRKTKAQSDAALQAAQIEAAGKIGAASATAQAKEQSRLQGNLPDITKRYQAWEASPAGKAMTPEQKAQMDGGTKFYMSNLGKMKRGELDETATEMLNKIQQQLLAAGIITTEDIQEE